MSDVRLVGTDPADGSLVPVAVTSGGLLKTQVGTIEEIPNDVTISGNLTVTGTINGDQGGGSGLPEPYGPEGSYLAIQDGQPGWVEAGEGPGPDPEPPTPQAIFQKSIRVNPAEAYTVNDIPNSSITDYNAFMEGLPSWEQPGTDKRMGFGRKSSLSCSFDVEFEQTLGLILNIQAACFIETKQPSSGGSDYTFSLTTSSLNMQPVRETWTKTGNGSSMVSDMFTFSYLLNRDSFTAEFEAQMSGSFDSDKEGTGFYIQKWWLEDTGAFLMNDYLRRQQQMDALQQRIIKVLSVVDPTSDIDLLRQS